MSGRGQALLTEVHELARAYGWSERDIFSLTLSRRLSYRLLLEADADAALLGGPGTVEPS